MTILDGPCTQEQADFALQYREFVLPRLMVLCRGWAVLMGQGEADFLEASGNLMQEAVRLGCTYMHPDYMDELEEYLGNELASMAFAAELAQENAL